MQNCGATDPDTLFRGEPMIHLTGAKDFKCEMSDTTLRDAP